MKYLTERRSCEDVTVNVTDRHRTGVLRTYMRNRQARIQVGGTPGARPLLFSEGRRFLKIVTRSYVILHITVYGLRKISVSGSLIALSTLLVCVSVLYGSSKPPICDLAADFKSKALLFMCKTCIRTVKDSAQNSGVTDQLGAL